MSHIADESKRRLAPRTKWILVGVALLSLVVAVFVVTAVASRARWREQIRRIEARGEPLVLPAPPTQPTVEGERTRAWSSQVADCGGPDDEWMLESADGLRAYREHDEWKQLTSEQRERLERLAVCLGPGSRWDRDDSLGTLQDEAGEAMLDALPPERWDPCVQDFVRSRECTYPQMIEPLRVANTLVALDKTPNRGVERIPNFSGIYATTRAALAPVQALVLQRDVDAIAWRLGTVLHLRDLLESHAGLQVDVMRRFMLVYVLTAAKFALAQLPPEVSLAPLESLLAKIDDPVREFRRALVEERAIGNEMFESLTGIETGTPRPWSIESVWLDMDQAVYLDTLSSAIEAIDAPRIEQTEARLAELQAAFLARAQSFWARFTPVSMMLVPKFAEDWRRAEDQRVQLALVRLALRVRSLEATAARETAEREPDPWGQSMHSRLEADGVLVLWSVGANHRDEGAPPALDPESARERIESSGAKFDDVVVRVRMR